MPEPRSEIPAIQRSTNPLRHGNRAATNPAKPPAASVMSVANPAWIKRDGKRMQRLAQDIAAQQIGAQNEIRRRARRACGPDARRIGRRARDDIAQAHNHRDQRQTRKARCRGSPRAGAARSERTVAAAMVMARRPVAASACAPNSPAKSATNLNAAKTSSTKAATFQSCSATDFKNSTAAPGQPNTHSATAAAENSASVMSPRLPAKPGQNLRHKITRVDFEAWSIPSAEARADRVRPSLRWPRGAAQAARRPHPPRPP